MSKIQLEKQEAQPIDEATRMALEQAREELRRGEGVTLEEARLILQKQRQGLRKAQQEVLAA